MFRNALQYSVIMAVAIFIALAFNIQRAYWVPLSAHAIMLGNVTTIRTLDRSLARGLGTIVGTIVLSCILAFHINTIRAVFTACYSLFVDECLYVIMICFICVLVCICRLHT